MRRSEVARVADTPDTCSPRLKPRSEYGISALTHINIIYSHFVLHMQHVALAIALPCSQNGQKI